MARDDQGRAAPPRVTFGPAFARVPAGVLLDRYLNDHLAGANTGCELAARLARRFRGTAREPVLAALEEGITVDRATLVALMEEMHVPRSRWRQALGSAAGRASRLATGDPRARRRGLAALREMEALGAGIAAKSALWKNLRAVEGSDHRLAGAGLDVLVRRAEEQFRDLDRERTSFAAELFTGRDGE